MVLQNPERKKFTETFSRSEGSTSFPGLPDEDIILAQRAGTRKITEILDQNRISGYYPYSRSSAGSPLFARTGCGPTSMAMILEYYRGRRSSQENLAHSLGQQLAEGGYHGRNGTTWDGIVAVMAWNGVRGQVEDFGDVGSDRYSQYKHSKYLESLRDHFQYGGGPVIVPLISPGHILVVSGYEANRGFKILDPDGGKTYFRKDLNSNAYIQFFD